MTGAAKGWGSHFLLKKFCLVSLMFLFLKLYMFM